jgi:iron complex transport system permease protein
MKITLDISKLVEDGKLTPAEAERLKLLALHDTGSFGINVLIAFGVIAVSAGAAALVPTALTALILGIVMFSAGLAIVLNRVEQWRVLGQILLVIGALMFCAGVIGFGEGSLASMLIVTAALALASVAARSGLLMALSVLAASACLGAKTGYSHAAYSLAIFEPALTVVLFSALALAAYITSQRMSADFERIALIAARTSVVLINFGFWIGSLWGDPLVLLRGMAGSTDTRRVLENVIIPSWAFSIGWALVLLAAGIWAARVNRRWLVNTAAVFGAIHFYTQWFERLGATPVSVLLGGLAMLAIAMALWLFNRRATNTLV